MARSRPTSPSAGTDSIEPGWPVYSSDAEHIGDVQRTTSRFLVLAPTPTLPRERFVPLSSVVRAEHGRVELGLSRHEVDSRGADFEREASETHTTTNQNELEQRRVLELHEERLEAHKELEEAGRVRLRKQVDTVPRRLEVEALAEEVTVEHVPVGKVVQERQAPREDDGVFIVPIYEEQLVVVKRLVLTEEIHVRRQGVTQRHTFEDSVSRERLVIEDPDRTGRVREHYATKQPEGERVAGDLLPGEEDASEQPGFLERLGRKVLE